MSQDQDKKQSTEQKSSSQQDKPQASKEAKAESKPEVKAETKAESKPEVKAESKPEVKAETKAESKPEVKAEAKPEVKAKVQPEAKPEAPAEAQASGEVKPETKDENSVELDGLFAFKMAMTTFYNKEGHQIPVTALKYKPWVVSQVKTEEKEGYSAIQLACSPQKNARCSRAVINHLKPAGFKEGARFIQEIRQKPPEGIKVGQNVSIESLKQGDKVKLSSVSKGLGFTGVMKRWNFGGGRASHGSKSHRRTGSIGQHTEPARVMPGRKMPGHCGFQKVSRVSEIVEVYPKEGVLFVKGPVSGARNTLVTLQKQGASHG